MKWIGQSIILLLSYLNKAHVLPLSCIDKMARIKTKPLGKL